MLNRKLDERAINIARSASEYSPEEIKAMCAVALEIRAKTRHFLISGRIPQGALNESAIKLLPS